jgi:GH15 family glucan-1,4-alpha-glucosidase
VTEGATEADRYPPIAAYALIGDCRTGALVSRAGSIDWWCAPRFDSGSVFGRILDAERGGFCSLSPDDPTGPPEREYVGDTLVLATTFRAAGGEARLIDFLAIPPPDHGGPDHRRLVRIVEGIRGCVTFQLELRPRFDYGALAPWIRDHEEGVFDALGGDDGLVIWSDAPLTEREDGVDGELTVEAGERRRLSIDFMRPEVIDNDRPPRPDADGIDTCLESTLSWWDDWAKGVSVEGPGAAAALRSALVLKALTHEPTGAMVAAPTTSLPEAPGGERNWDYRYSWIRDSALAARSLAEIDCEPEADAFRHFIERTTAGRPDDLRIMYGVGGERRVPELELGDLEGYAGAAPVHVGNKAAGQHQFDSFGQLLDQSWRWHCRGHSPNDDYWRFIVALVDAAIASWRKPDRGIWEWRDGPMHFVHSKALLWSAIERGLRLASETGRDVPEERWRRARDELKEAIDREGYDEGRGTFVQAFGSSELDAAVLRLPTVGFIDFRDARMVSTVDVIARELTEDGLVRRYSTDDGLEGREGAFLPCTFWLAECLARQGRTDEAQAAFDRATATANDVGLFSEEYDPGRGEMLGNFPQALTHLSHLEAVLALSAGLPAAGDGRLPKRAAGTSTVWPKDSQARSPTTP